MMGSGASHHDLSALHLEELQKDEGLKAVQKALGLDGGDENVWTIFEAFADLDKNKDGKVSLPEFLARHKGVKSGRAGSAVGSAFTASSDHHVHFDTFLWRFFRVMGPMDGEVESLDPIPFFVSLHQFLIEDEAATLKMCFRMFDKDHNAHLDVLEFAAMCRLARPELSDAEVDTMMLDFNFKHRRTDTTYETDLANTTGGDDLDMDEVLYHKHRDAFLKILWPIFKAGEELRYKIGGEEYWARRQHHFKQYNATHSWFKNDLIALYHDRLSEIDKIRVLRRRAAEKKKLDDEQEALDDLVREEAAMKRANADATAAAELALEEHANDERGKVELRDGTLDWTEYKDPSTGYPYWYNNISGLSTWDEPPTLVAARENAAAEAAEARALAQ